jgi:hypothetical protein
MTKTELADSLDTIIKSVELLNKALTDLLIAVEKDEKAEAAPAPTETSAQPITIEEVRAALTKLATAKGSAASKAVLKDFGAEKLSDIAAQDYAQLLDTVARRLQ